MPRRSVTRLRLWTIDYFDVADDKSITLKYPLSCRRQPPMCIGACAPPASYVRPLPELRPETGTSFVPSGVVGLHSGMHERLPLREWHSTARPGFARCSV